MKIFPGKLQVTMCHRRWQWTDRQTDRQSDYHRAPAIWQGFKNSRWNYLLFLIQTLSQILIYIHANTSFQQKTTLIMGYNLDFWRIRKYLQHVCRGLLWMKKSNFLNIKTLKSMTECYFITWNNFKTTSDMQRVVFP